MPKAGRFTSPLWDLDCMVLFDDFTDDQVDTRWTDVVTDTGTVAVGDASRGIAVLTPSDGTVADNDEVYLRSANEVFLIADGRPMYGRARLQFTETAAGVYNAFFGFGNAIAADFIVDDGAGLRASGTIIALEKRDGETLWRLTTRNGSAVTSTLSTKTAGGAAYQSLELFVNEYDGTSCIVTARVDGDFLKDSSGNMIRHTMLYASATEMHVGAGAKLGAITINDVLNLDFVYAHQYRG